MFYCSKCGSKDTKQTETGNGGDLYVGESLDSCEECYDGEIQMIECNKCKSITYVSIGS